MGTTYRVASAAELESVLSTATGGDIIELAAGNYGDLYLKNSVYSGEVTITSADPDNMAVFKGIQLLNSGNVTFDGIHLDLDPQDGDVYNVGLRITKSSNVTIENSVVEGGFIHNPDNPALDDYPVGRGVFAISSENITVRNNDMFNLDHAVLHNNSDTIIIDNNDLHDTRKSPIAGGGSSNVEITNNALWNVEPYGFGTATGDHADMIHFYPVYSQGGGVQNITITGNTMQQGDSPTPVLGVYLDDYGIAGEGLGYTNVTISNNVLHNGNAQGIRIENTNGLTITDNTLMQSIGGGKDAPSISLIANTRNAIVDNNIVAGTVRGTSVDDAKAQNITIGDNLHTQRTDPNGENYAGNLFVNALDYQASLTELQAIPGSEADGYGATFTRLDSAPDVHTAIISSHSGDGMGMKTVSFDVEAFFGPSGEIDPEGAQIRWDFPDGSTAFGETVYHTFESAGLYDVEVTVTPVAGPAFTVGKTVAVKDPFAIRADFAAGGKDLSDLENPVTAEGSVSYEASELGSSLRLGTSTSRLSFEQSPELLNNPEFTFSLAFNKDAGAQSLSGHLAYLSGTTVLSTNKGEITLGAMTSTGDTIDLEYQDASIDDGAWHQTTYTYSEETGTASLYFDGKLVDQQTGLTGVQYTANGHDLHLGGLSKGSFQGLLDNVIFAKTALSALEVSEAFGDMTSFETEDFVFVLDPVVTSVTVESVSNPPNTEELVLAVETESAVAAAAVAAAAAAEPATVTGDVSWVSSEAFAEAMGELFIEAYANLPEEGGVFLELGNVEIGSFLANF